MSKEASPANFNKAVADWAGLEGIDFASDKSEFVDEPGKYGTLTYYFAQKAPDGEYLQVTFHWEERAELVSAVVWKVPDAPAARDVLEGRGGKNE